MRAAVLHGLRDIRLEDIPTPKPREDEVVVRILVNGLCGSDIHFFERGRLGPFVVDRPYIPGHEASGVVVRAAADGSGPPEGARVTVEPGIPCRRCVQCKSGRYNLCPDVVFMSAPPVNGTFAEQVAVVTDFVHPIPDAMDDESGAFVEPVSVGVQACTRADLRAGGTVVVLGAGPIGLITLLVARAFGAARLIVVDRIPSRLALAGRLGGLVIDASKPGIDVPAEVNRVTDGRNAEFVFDATGSSAACSMAPLLAARGGSVTLIGWPETSTPPMPVEVIMERELDLHGVNRYCNTYPRAIALMAAGAIDTRPLVSHRYTFASVCDAFAFSSLHKEETVKVLVKHE
jgi:L-iditol 2-dehydrogenase